MQQMGGDQPGDAPADDRDPHAQARPRTLAGTAWRFLSHWMNLAGNCLGVLIGQRI
jgi:hypothetical protein